MTTKTTSPIHKFFDLNLAKSFASHTIKPMGLINGDDGKFWVCSLADAEILFAQGYEYAV